MFMSTRSGELRKAADGGLSWAVRDDGHGFPCFVHMEGGQTVYEDPRFVADPEEDLAAARKVAYHSICIIPDHHISILLP